MRFILFSLAAAFLIAAPTSSSAASFEDCAISCPNLATKKVEDFLQNKSRLSSADQNFIQRSCSESCKKAFDFQFQRDEGKIAADKIS